MRKLKTLLTMVLPICLSVAAGAVIVVLNSQSILHTRAASIVENEKSEMKNNISDLKSEKKKLERKKAEYDKILDDNETLLSELEALHKDIEDYDKDISRATEKNTELDSALSEKQNYLEGLGSIKPDTEGGNYTLKDDDYKCPADIPAGKYKAEGTGKIYLKDISNRRKDKIDLSTVDSNTYVFEIASGESITVDGTVKLTEQIRN